MVIAVPLKDIIVDSEGKVDLSALPEAEAIALIKKSYGFLASTIEVSIEGGIAVIRVIEEKARQVDEAGKLYNRGVKKAESGEYESAIQLFKRALSICPEHADARRNLAMSYLESGNKDEAKNQLIDSLRLNHKDVWSLLLLANIYSKHEDDLDAAERFYQKAHEINPDDSYVLTSYAALKVERGKPEEARAFFQRAIQVNPKYPNPFYGLALLDFQNSKMLDALATLNQLFDKASSQDPRSAPVFNEARAMYLAVNGKIAEASHVQLSEFLEDRKKELEKQTGFAIQCVEDSSLANVSAVSEMAWRHQRQHHKIRYRAKTRALAPHFIAHELEHIDIEHEDRVAGKNRTFTTTAATREFAIRSVADHVSKLQKSGYPEEMISTLILQMTSGLANQIFNCPLDMAIESRLFRKYEILRPVQFVSLAATHAEVAPLLKNEEIKRFTPPSSFVPI